MTGRDLDRRAARRLLAWALCVVTALGVLEALVRAREPLFEAARHRALAKAALLDRQPPVDVLVLGTSRLQDGIAPRLLAAALGEGVRSFNLAFTSSTLESLDAMADRFAARPGLRVVLVELSAPQLVRGKPAWDDEPEPSPGVEGTLEQAVREHVRLVRQRRSLVPENLARLPALLVYPESLDGSEVKFAEQLAAAVGRRARPASDFDAALWRLAPTPRLDTSAEHGVADRLAALARRIRAAGPEVAFVVPPLSRRFQDAEERSGGYRALFALVAARSGAPVWDFSPHALPERFFRDTTHLNAEGRAHFSRALAEHVAAAGFLASGSVARGAP